MAWQRTFPLARLLRLIAGVSVSFGILRYVAAQASAYTPNNVLWWLQIGCGPMMTAAALFNSQPGRHLHWLALVWQFACLHFVAGVVESHHFCTLTELLEWLPYDVPICLAVPLCFTVTTWLTIASSLVPKGRGQVWVIVATGLSISNVALVICFLYCIHHQFSF